MFIELLVLQDPIKGQRKTTSIFEAEYVNINLILRLKRREDNKATIVFASDFCHDFVVKETPEEILKKIKLAQQEK